MEHAVSASLLTIIIFARQVLFAINHGQSGRLLCVCLCVRT